MVDIPLGSFVVYFSSTDLRWKQHYCKISVDSSSPWICIENYHDIYIYICAKPAFVWYTNGKWKNGWNCSAFKLDRTRHKASEICLRFPLGIYSHAFSRKCPEPPNMTSCKVALKLRISTDRDQNLISSESDEDTPTCQHSGHSSHAFWRKYPKISNMTSFSESKWR